MLPDDVFHARLRTTIAELGGWANALRKAARVEETHERSFWQLRVAPEAENACPFELILHDDQHFDLVVGPETYERLPINDLTLFPHLVDAITAGRVITRRMVSRNTRTLCSIETLIVLADGDQWRRARFIGPAAAAAAADEWEGNDECYVPYERG